MLRPELLRRAACLAAADLADAADRRGVLQGLVRIAGGGTMAGFARTARAVPGDADSVHAAVLSAGEGDVVVVDFGGPDVGVAGVGDLLAAEGRRRRLVGVVLYGPARDAAGLAEVGLPVYATGLTPAAGYHDRIGELDVEVEIAGVAVRPGDLVVGDADGVVAVPAGEAEAVVARAESVHAADAELRRRVLAGAPLDGPELQAYLASLKEQVP